MRVTLKKAVPAAALILAALTLTACLVEPAPYYGETYYAQPAPVYVGPSYYYGPGWGYGRGYGWRGYGWRGGGWHGGGWHGGGWHGGGWHGGHH